MTGCVHKINAFGGQRLAHADVHARIDRAHVDDHGALGRPGRDPALAEHDLFRVGGAGDEHQDDPGPCPPVPPESRTRLTPASEARLTAGGYGSYPATGTPLSINFFAQLLP